MKILYSLPVAIMVSIAFSTLAAEQLKPEQIGRGGEWLSWTPLQRSAYAYGFVDGYFIGFFRACRFANKTDYSKPHRIGEKDDFERCLDHRGEFSKKSLNEVGQLDVSAYTDVVTAFYTDHPSCNGFPFSFLLQSLSSKLVTSDQLYEMALKGGFDDYARSRQWCSGSQQAPKP